jgi:hypothetical protein
MYHQPRFGATINEFGNDAMATRIDLPEKLSEESDFLYEAINKQDDDLVCALVAGAFLEKAITSLLSQFFFKGSRTAKELLAEYGFLGQFVRCAKLAYCLGLISKGACENLRIIANIRNAFAHSHTPVHFTDGDVSAKCMCLILPRLAQPVPERGDGEPSKWETSMAEPRTRFMVVSVMLFNRLLQAAREIEPRQQLVDDGWPAPPSPHAPEKS